MPGVFFEKTNFLLSIIWALYDKILALWQFSWQIEILFNNISIKAVFLFFFIISIFVVYTWMHVISHKPVNHWGMWCSWLTCTFVDNLTSYAGQCHNIDQYILWRIILLHYAQVRKKLFQFCKTMKIAIWSRKEVGAASSQQIGEAQWKILGNIKFVDHTLELDQMAKQKPLTRSFHNLITNIESFKEKNCHTNVLDPNAKLIKAVKDS